MRVVCAGEAECADEGGVDGSGEQVQGVDREECRCQRRAQVVSEAADRAALSTAQCRRGEGRAGHCRLLADRSKR